MISVFFALFAWFFSLLGIGIQTASIIKFSVTEFETKDRITLWGILGIATVGLLSSVFNFFIPINPVLASSFFILGLLLSLKHRQKIGHVIQKHDFFGLLIVLAVLSAIIASAQLFFLDTAVYHLQAIRWITESTAPLGLANLIGKLGFNSLWFPTAAMLEIFGLQGKSSFLLNPLLFIFFLFPLFSTLKSIKEKNPLSLKDVFLLTSVLSFIYPFFIEAYIVSPSNDAPILTLGLFIFYLLLSKPKPPLFFLFFLSCYAFMIKLSAFPLLLLVPLLLVTKRIYSLKKINWQGCAFIFSIGVSWILRGIYSSGCPFYPKSLGCQHQLEWTASRALIQGEYDLIKSWARKPYLSPEDKVMESWDWFYPWFIDLLKTPSFQIAFFLFFFGIVGVIYFNIKAKQETKTYLFEIALPATLSFIGILFWFGMAPAPRFGLAFIYGLSVLLFSFTIQSSGILNRHQRQSPTMLLLIIIVACLPIAQRMHFSKETWIFLPKHPVVKTEIQSTLENEEMIIPKENPLCWNSTLPCVAVFNPELRVKKKPGARLPYQFYFGEDFKKAGENYAKLRESI